MKYISFTCNPIQENTYLLWDEETLEAAILDPGCWNRHEEQLLEGSIRAHQLKLKYVLQTHGRFDHTFGLPFVYRTFGIKPIFHIDEEQTYRDMPAMAAEFGLNIGGGMPPIERLLHDGDELKLGKTAIRLIHTPGHTPGSSSFYIPDAQLVLCGDTLFAGSMGRSDLPGGSLEAELDSIRNKLFRLPDEVTVLCGHGPNTTIGYEKQYNPCAL